MSSVFRVFLEKLGGADATTFVGNEGELFFDPTSATLRISDGSTPGGTILSGASAINIAALADVVYNNVQSGDGLVYNAIESRWENETQPKSTFTYAQYKYKRHDSGNPNAGEVRISHSDVTQTDELHISHLTENGVDLSILFSEGLITSVGFYIQDKDDASNFVLLQVSGSAIEQGSHHLVPVKYLSHSGVISNNQKVMVGTYVVGETFKVYPAPAPSTTSSSGEVGEIRYDNDHLYICIADNTWKRANLSTWS